MIFIKIKEKAEMFRSYLGVGYSKLSKNYERLIENYMKLEEKGVSGSRDKINKVFDFLEGKGKFLTAGKYAEKNGQLERAIKNYENSGKYWYEKKVPEIHERMHQYPQAIRLYVNQRNFLEAGRLSEKIGNKNMAKRYFREAFCYWSAMEIKSREKHDDPRLIEIFALTKEKAREAFKRNGGTITEDEGERSMGVGKYILFGNQGYVEDFLDKR